MESASTYSESIGEPPGIICSDHGDPDPMTAAPTVSLWNNSSQVEAVWNYRASYSGNSRHFGQWSPVVEITGGGSER